MGKKVGFYDRFYSTIIIESVPKFYISTHSRNFCKSMILLIFFYVLITILHLHHNWDVQNHHLHSCRY